MYRFILFYFVLYICIYVAPWSCEARHLVPLYVHTCSGMTIKLNLNLNLNLIKHYFYTRRCTGLCGAKCFLELRDKILEFLQNHDHTLSKQLTGVFWIKTAYLVDIFTLYNKTNRRLQCTESNILECKEAIDAFTRKL